MTHEIERELREGLAGVTEGPWMVYDGCSWRRIGIAHGRRDDCAVLAPCRASDGHPDLYASRGNDVHANLEHIARCDPATIRYLLDEIERLRKPLSRLEEGLRNNRLCLSDVQQIVDGALASRSRGNEDAPREELRTADISR